VFSRLRSCQNAQREGPQSESRKRPLL